MVDGCAGNSDAICSDWTPLNDNDGLLLYAASFVL
jgi:hypothetical protein